MEIGNIIPHIEAVIFASDKPLTTLEITDIINNAFGFMEDKIVLDQVETAMEGVLEKYRSEFYPFEVRESGGGWQFLTKRDFHKTIAQLNGDKFLKRLSAAALETLAIIAYKQPITKSEIEAIRGVNCDYAVQRLLEKELIVITGRNENMPGKPLVYGTSKGFMDYFGLNTADDLPKIKEVLADQIIEPTIINGEGLNGAASAEAAEGEIVQETSNASFAVTPDGELITSVEMEYSEEAGQEEGVAGQSDSEEEHAPEAYYEESTEEEAAEETYEESEEDEAAGEETEEQDEEAGDHEEDEEKQD
ncbi:MAG: SMC-Scp complex subunit ScpB [Bacteroidetes bacterium]|nr:SMC-Scp complex subunit ScpB [Bacteroidota bacterium]